VAWLTGRAGSWPGAAIVWVDVRGSASRLLGGPPPRDRGRAVIGVWETRLVAARSRARSTPRRPGVPAGVGGYDEFAWLYEREWGSVSLAFVPALDALVLDALPVGARILDLACGTGRLAARLADRGFRVTGLDSSPQMLALARANAPGIDFVLADARSFVLHDAFDAAVSVYDSLNHIMTVAELREVFERVHAVLNPGGRFVFDLMTEDGYPAQWERSFVGDDHAAIVRSSYDRTTRTMRFEATIFRPGGGRWERADVALQQHCHAEADVRAALDAAGFIDVVAVPAQQFGARQPGRVFYAANR
jgi:SAM-dependent methyltransferase